MAAPVRTGWSRTEGGSTAVSVDLSAVPTGAWMIIALVTGGNVEIATRPEGWRNPLANPTQLAGSRRLALAYKIKGAETAAVWESVSSVGKVALLMWGTGAEPDVNQWLTGLIGVRNATNVVAGQSVQAGDSFHSVAPGVAVTEADSLVISFLFEATSATGTFTLTSGATLWFETPETVGFIEASAVGYTTPGVETTEIVTATATATQASNGAGVQIVIPPGDTPPPPTPDPGFHSVGQMLATPGATWAHRGGSLNWPEMSEYAYDQAALAGYGALEFSAQRTSDGVWIGCHDNDLNRTSQTTGLPNVSAMTWAEVQTHMNTLNSGGVPRPYYRLIDFLDKYTPTHVVIVDNKTSANTPEFFDILDAHGGPSKIVAKAFGVGTGAGTSTQAAARGYEAWGYFYEESFTDGNLALYQGNWSILGMNINAGDPAWAAVTGYGKPVTGHIAQDQAMYDSAIAKGSRMVQCSNVVAIAEVSRISPEDQPWNALRLGADIADAVYVGDTQIWP